jgi:peptide deformylase
MNSRTFDIIRLGHPVLRQKAEPVPESWFDTERLRTLAKKLVKTMMKEDGVGLAAPQVAESLRLFAYWIPGDDDRPTVDPIVVVNPEVRPIGDEKVRDWEGCLSVPGLRGLVPRHNRIKVKGRSINGNPISLTADGFHARVIQHEYDHLDGVIYIDRMTDLTNLVFEEEWARYIAASHE